MTEQNPRYSIGVDLGGTNLRAAAIDSAGRMLGKVAGQTQLSAGPDAVVRDMVAAIVKLRSQFGEDRLAGIGIGSPGIIVMETGMIMEVPNLPGFEEFPLRDRVNRALGAPVILENDANAAALGEKWVGAVGMAGELGHIRVVPNGNPCACGNRGGDHAEGQGGLARGRPGARRVIRGRSTPSPVFGVVRSPQPGFRTPASAQTESLGVRKACWS